MITCLFACDLNGVIGVNGKLPWNIPSDLENFKKLTLNKTVIMGRKTYESIGHPLPNRRNIVLTKGKIEGVETYTSLNEAISHCKEDEVFLIGGKRVLEEGFSVADKVIITSIPICVEEQRNVKVDLSFKKNFTLKNITHVSLKDELDYYIMDFDRT
jgi:dihydrofolate reductase